jgi:hypothetical protein
MPAPGNATEQRYHRCIGTADSVCIIADLVFDI